MLSVTIISITSIMQSIIKCIIYAKSHLCWMSFVLSIAMHSAVMLSVINAIIYAKSHLCWVSFMLSIAVHSAVMLCCLCWVLFMLSVVYAECHLCWVSFMLSVIYAECCDHCSRLLTCLGTLGIAPININNPINCRTAQGAKVNNCCKLCQCKCSSLKERCRILLAT